MLLNWNDAERFLISHKWRLHSQFLDLVEPHLEKTLQVWEQAVEQQGQLIKDEDERNEFYEYHSEEYHEQLEFRVILMNSYFSACIALLENQLLRICRRAQRSCGSPFSVYDLGSASYTDRAKRYLEKLDVAFPADTPEWQRITRYRVIRNKIMHEDGAIPPEGDITDFAKAQKIVSTSGGNPRLDLTRPFCDEAVEVMRRFLLDVHRAYELWLKANG